MIEMPEEYHRDAPLTRCPCCDSHNVGSDDITDYYGEALIDDVVCNDCGAKWENIYKFSYSRVTKQSVQEGLDDDALKRLGVI